MPSHNIDICAAVKVERALLAVVQPAAVEAALSAETQAVDRRDEVRDALERDLDGYNLPAGTSSAGEIRKKSLEAVAATLNASQRLEVVTNRYSLEAEILAAGNDALMRVVFLECHPKSAAKWDAAAVKTGDDRAEAIKEIFEGVRKGDFAQRLAEKIHAGGPFVVPTYLKDAIERLVK